jgi:pimeloyl-ACP methyl ester carboxylesterase
MSSRSVLLTRRRGPETATPFLVLHDRWGMLEDAEKLAELLGPEALTIAVRGARVQNQGGSGFTHGYFWTIGPLERPELSTLGDALYQLELLLEDNWERYGRRKLGLLGKGQGGVMALILAAFFPDRVGKVIAIDAVLPINLPDMPFEPSLAGVEVVLAHSGPVQDALVKGLERLGAVVRPIPAESLSAVLHPVP